MVVDFYYTRALPVDVSAADQEMDFGDFKFAKGFLVTTAGDLVIDTVGGDTEVTVPVFAGINPIAATKVYNDGTTAGGVVAVY